ncbi:MAG: hypothetical protein HOP29_10885 [Phycisphaerales bacterium]|nr:hypothetical protein [Phycisphaerales bacterium]
MATDGVVPFQPERAGRMKFGFGSTRSALRRTARFALFYGGLAELFGEEFLRPEGAAECSYGWGGATAKRPDAEPVEAVFLSQTRPVRVWAFFVSHAF